MRAIVCTAPGKMTLANVPEPEPSAGWVRVGMKAAAICATDFEVLAGRIPAEYPVTPGHEWSGTVEAAADQAGARWIGRRVSGHNEVCCGQCAYCRTGQWRCCPEYRQIGFGVSGGYAESLLVPVANLIELEDAISFEQGCLLEPLGVGIAVARMAEARIGNTAAVLGCGPIGLNCIACLRASGAAPILCLDRREDRLAMARKFGAAAGFADAGSLQMEARQRQPGGCDIAVEASGSPELLRHAMELVRFGGVIVLTGYFRRTEVSFLPDKIHERNVRLLGAGNNAGFTGIAARAVAEGVVRTESMITHRFRLEEFETALAVNTAAQAGYVKGIFRL